jgi:hypothetical protein
MGSALQDAAARQEAAVGRCDAQGAVQDGGRDAAERDARERAVDGESIWNQPHERAAHLDRSRTQAGPGTPVQDIERPAVRGGTGST